MFGVARDFRKTHGEEAFKALVTSAFVDTDADGNGSIDKGELRACLKKLGIHLTGQTGAILEHYDTDKSGLIEEEEFLQLVSDLIDGTFEKTLQPRLEAQMKLQQQQAVVVHQQQASEALIAEVVKLRSELAVERTANGTLRQQVTTLKKEKKTLELKLFDLTEASKKTIKQLEQEKKLREMSDKTMRKLG